MPAATASDSEIPLTFAVGPSDPVCLADQPGTWVAVAIAAPAERVWELVSDINLPARFSDEFVGASWRDGDVAEAGACFVGRNRHPAIGEWEAESFVEVYEPGLSFGWATSDPGNPGARWRFDLEAKGSSTTLRYSMSIGPGPSGISMAIAAMPDKEDRILARRVREHHANMARTVEGIKSLAEGES